MKLKLSAAQKIFGTGQIEINKAATAEDGTFEFIASGIKVDRYGEVVVPEGWDFKAFKKNPVMLWGHDHKVPAIAQVVKIWKDDKQVYAQAKWAPTPFAQELRQLVEGGFIRAVSVGFIPREWEGEWPNYKYVDQELLEISVVNVPAYADALISEAKSLGLQNVLKAFETHDPHTAPVTTEKTQPEQAKGQVSIASVELTGKNLVLHFSDFSRKHFELGEGTDLSTVLDAVAKEKNVILFTADELEAFKKELSEPLPADLLKKLESFGNNLSVVSDSLKALTAKNETATGDEGRTVKPEKKAVEVDPVELVRTASKAMEAALLTMRKGAKK